MSQAETGLNHVTRSRVSICYLLYGCCTRFHACITIVLSTRELQFQWAGELRRVEGGYPTIQGYTHLTISNSSGNHFSLHNDQLFIEINWRNKNSCLYMITKLSIFFTDKRMNFTLVASCRGGKSLVETTTSLTIDPENSAANVGENACFGEVASTFWIEENSGPQTLGVLCPCCRWNTPRYQRNYSVAVGEYCFTIAA